MDQNLQLLLFQLAKTPISENIQEIYNIFEKNRDIFTDFDTRKLFIVFLNNLVSKDIILEKKLKSIEAEISYLKNSKEEKIRIEILISILELIKSNLKS